MPLPRQAQGRPGTPVIPAGWQEAHAAVVDRTLTGKVRVGVAGGKPVWNEGLGQMVTPEVDPVYDGPGTLMPVSDTARALTVVEDPVTTRVYDLTLPFTASAAVTTEHTVFVDECDDPMLTGRRLKIHAIERGSRRFSRVLLATLLD